jgi:hypothetical protein
VEFDASLREKGSRGRASAMRSQRMCQHGQARDAPFASLSTRYTEARPILSRLAIMVAPSPSRLSAAIWSASIFAGRPRYTPLTYPVCGTAQKRHSQF